jgi:hypothetical protein
MRNLMTVEAKGVCKDPSKWKEVTSAYPNGKRDWCYVCMYLAMRNSTVVTGGKPIAVWSQPISGVSVKPLVAYDILKRKGEALFFYSVPDTTRAVITFPSVANTLYSKISLLVILSWYFELPEGVNIRTCHWRFIPGGVETSQVWLLIL